MEIRKHYLKIPGCRILSPLGQRAGSVVKNTGCPAVVGDTVVWFQALTWWLTTTGNFSPRASDAPFVTSSGSRHAHGAQTYIQATHAIEFKKKKPFGFSERTACLPEWVPLRLDEDIHHSSLPSVHGRQTLLTGDISTPRQDVFNRLPFF